MQIFINFEEDIAAEEVATELRGDRYTEHLNKSVEELELSVRSYNCLKNANIQTIGDLVVRSENDMLKTKNSVGSRCWRSRISWTRWACSSACSGTSTAGSSRARRAASKSGGGALQ